MRVTIETTNSEGLTARKVVIEEPVDDHDVKAMCEIWRQSLFAMSYQPESVDKYIELNPTKEGDR